MKNKTKSLTKIALLTALICVGSAITIPMNPVPITLQTFFVMMAGVLLTPVEAFLSVFIYILLGLIGLPVFAGFNGGFGTVFTPSFGFIIGFAIGAYVISSIVKNTTDRKKLLISLLIGQVIFYAIGLPYMYVILNSLGKAPDSLYTLLSWGLIPFIPGALIKTIAVVIIAPKVKNALNKM
ncbi:biotin transporter BioY [Peptoniphilus sp. oral taxon 386]|uniref:biotin transporter BioY n=1 Tax=Peptoniphilus sp. oral taxon 386 TaxID=652713 RepID=UPI0001DAA481|nr:biotin transporter BioY [Peptoniphilus sp. oral taxon 386]EFI41370.1 BioY family protein [Peptoniphilus sp. oral taxon 386 str. F0131]